MFLKKNI